MKKDPVANRIFWNRLRIVAIVSLALAGLFAAHWLPTGFSLRLFYILLLLTTWFVASWNAPLWIAACNSLCIVVDLFFGPDALCAGWVDLMNRIFAILALFIVGYLIRLAKVARYRPETAPRQRIA